MAEKVQINLAQAQGYSLAAWSQWSDIRDDVQYRVGLSPLREQVFATAYAAEFMGLSALGVPYPSMQSRMDSGIGALAPSLRGSVARPYVIDLYAASIRTCRWIASRGIDTPRSNMPRWSPGETPTGAAIVRTAAASPMLVTAGIVGVVAAAAAAIAWWQRGRDEAAMTGAAIKHGAAVAAAAQLAQAYVATGQDPPPELIRSIAALAKPELERSTYWPIVAVGAVGAVAGAGAYAYSTR